MVIIPIIKKETDREPVMAAVDGLAKSAKAAGIRVKVREQGRSGCVYLVEDKIIRRRGKAYGVECLC